MSWYIEPFRAPVDWKGLGLYDYPQLISRPMDLGTVKKRIVDRKYKSIHDAAEDVRLVWKNCMTYNADGSDFFLLAKTLDRKFEEKYTKLLSDLRIVDPRTSSAGGGGSGPASSSTTTGPGGVSASSLVGGDTVPMSITLDEKKSFARSLYKVTKEDLGKIILELESKCPAALTKNMAEDEATLNVDKITPQLFQELKAFVATCIKNNPAATASSGKKGTKRKKDT